MATQLLEPILTNGIRQTNFFNGRLLTATDLRDQQNANRRQHDQLGRAVGAGIVTGLEVTLGTASAAVPTVQVTKGLAFNRQGQALEVQQDLILDLARQRDQAATEAGLFANCGPPSSGTVALGRGIYLLALAPASGYQERVPLVRFNEADRATGCGDRYAVEGVQFRLVQLDLDDSALLAAPVAAQLVERINGNDVASRSLLRNQLAYLCFGLTADATPTRDLLAFVQPTATLAPTNLVDRLYATSDLQRCDVPLALLFWTTSGIQFIDMWAVRRRISRRSATTAWPFVQGDERLAVGEAAFLQFQQQIIELVDQQLTFGQARQINARDYFDFLPPVGVLPLQEGSRRGIGVDTFFTRQPHRAPEFIEGALVEPLLQQALYHSPVFTSERELVWVYRVRQNAQALNVDSSVRPYLIFTSRHVPYQAFANFDVARWEYGNYWQPPLQPDP